MKNQTIIGHAACFAAYLIFGINIILCKDLADSKTFSPLCIFTFRAAGASLVFWVLDLIYKYVSSQRGTAALSADKMDLRDLPKIFAASMLGLFLTQVSFLFGIGRTTPLDWSILSVMSPLFTMFTAAIVVKEPITWKKAGGVALSFAGVLVLIFNTSRSGGAESTSLLGVAMAFVNCLSFALYLGIFRPLIRKYRVVTFMKWMFLFSLIVSLPFTIKEVFTASYSAVPKICYLELGFLVVFATIIAYYLIPLGQKHVRPTLVSMYSYLQPILASVVSIWIGMDSLTWFKVVAAAAVVAGVVIVNRSRAKGEGQQ